MFDEVLALSHGTINQEFFDEKLAIKKHRFERELDTQVKDMLPDKTLPKIGNGYSKYAYIKLFFLRKITKGRHHFHLKAK